MEPQLITPSSNTTKEYPVSSSRRDGERRTSEPRLSSLEKESRRDKSDRTTAPRKYSSSHRDSERPRHSHKESLSSSSRDAHKESRSSHKSKEKRSSRHKGAPLDTIDRLDVTGFFGPGSFHHDGPFDACTPHRNKNTKKAPVAAFPINGANNSLAINVNRDRYTAENNILMQGDIPAYQDFSSGTSPRGITSNIMRNGNLNRSEVNVTFDPLSKAAPVHGDTTLGLGSSTFLEGTPASRTAVESAAQQAASVGVSRKKSLVNRLRGNSSSPAPPRPSRLSFDQGQSKPLLLPTSSSPSASSPRYRERSNSSGSVFSSRRNSKSGVQVTVTSPDVAGFSGRDGGMREGSPSTRGTGLLSRVRSLKSSGRRGSTSLF